MPDSPQPSASLPKIVRTNHIFVDFENIHELDLTLLADKPVIVHLVLGEQHKKLPLEIVEQLLQFPQQVRLIKAGKSGKNALDFVLAYHIGVATVADPKAFYHIVSRDTGFDALILHLKTHHILARRDESFAQAFDWQPLPVAPAAPISTTLADRVREVTARLTKNGKNRPKRKKTLLSQINAYYQKRLTEAELEDILQKLIKSQVITIGPTNEVIYKV